MCGGGLFFYYYCKHIPRRCRTTPTHSIKVLPHTTHRTTHTRQHPHHHHMRTTATAASPQHLSYPQPSPNHPHSSTMRATRTSTNHSCCLLLLAIKILLTNATITTLPEHHQWAYEGNVHPFDSKALRWQEAYWESKATLDVPSLEPHQLLVVLITTTARLPLVLASRQWRKDIATVIVSDRWLNETEYEAAFTQVCLCGNGGTLPPSS